MPSERPYTEADFLASLKLEGFDDVSIVRSTADGVPTIGFSGLRWGERHQRSATLPPGATESRAMRALAAWDI